MAEIYIAPASQAKMAVLESQSDKALLPSKQDRWKL